MANVHHRLIIQRRLVTWHNSDTSIALASQHNQYSMPEPFSAIYPLSCFKRRYQNVSEHHVEMASSSILVLVLGTPSRHLALASTSVLLSTSSGSITYDVAVTASTSVNVDNTTGSITSDVKVTASTSVRVVNSIR